MEKEIWKDIKGYEGIYQVSNLGRIKSLERNIKTKRYNKNGLTIKEKILKPVNNSWGYQVVVLFKNSNRNPQFIHRIVCNNFIENPLNKPEVNHIDGNKKNNNVNNLEWCTSHENGIHAWKIGLLDDFCRKKCKENLQKAIEKNKIKVNQYDLNGNFIKTWDSAKNAESNLKINCSHITHCCRKQRKTAGGFKWAYYNEKHRH